MTWTVDIYPSAIENLPSGVRRKAIELANSLLEKGFDETTALYEAIDRSRVWAKRELCGLLAGSSSP